MPVVKISRTVLAPSKEELLASVGFWQQRGWRVTSPPRLLSGTRNPSESWGQEMEYGLRSEGENVVIPASRPPAE